MKARDLIFNWGESPDDAARPSVGIVDETLRDGLQSGVPRLPTLDERLELLCLADEIGVREAVVGFPANPESGRRAIGLAKGARRQGLKLRIGLLGRLVADDVRAIHRVQEESGHPVLAMLFVGASPIRRYVEEWDLDLLEGRTREALTLAAELGVASLYGVEDGSRTEPEVTERLLLAAAESGAERVSSIDTTGSLTPWGTESMVKHYRAALDRHGFESVGMDLHGHMDLGYGIANPLVAVRAGMNNIHCTALGLGERAGNYPLEHVLFNLKQIGRWSGDLTQLSTYCNRVAQYCGIEVPDRHPIVGPGVFRTQVGLHAAAINKAEMMGEMELAALVYSGVDPHVVGMEYSIQVGPDSGRHNVRYILRRQGLEAEPLVLDRILALARDENRTLEESEVCEIAVAAGDSAGD